MAVWKERGVWRARVVHNKKNINLGTFKTKRAAERAIVKAKNVMDLPFEDFKSGFKQSKPKKNIFSKLIARFKR